MVRAGKHLIGMLLGAGLLWGCVAVSIQETEVDPYYTPDLVRSITFGGEFPSEIRGNPFAGQPEIGDKILNRLRMPGMFPQARFVPAASRDQHRVVLVFSPVLRGLRGKEACGGLAGMELAPAANELDLVAALCVGERVLTQIRVEGILPPGPDDAAFGRILDQSIVSLLPSNETDRTGGCEAGAPC
ncbi:MAG TPA: hypothetical protein QGF63_16295 [Alphaproteobacteria bacterium]|jgi:hypothetical protein|nr:hypothetical protein [Alphaproteobacteria bacterium]